MNTRQEARLAEVRNIVGDDTPAGINEAAGYECRETEGYDPGPEMCRAIESGDRQPFAIEGVDEINPQKHISPYPLTIEQVSNGFIVKVGCQTFVFEKFETACKYMTMYYNDVEGTRIKHANGTLFA